MNTRHLIALSLAGLALVAGHAALGATRTVCYELKFADARTNCATTTTTGNERGCSPGSNIDAAGHVVELWDKDDDGNDELIGKWAASAGRGCATFEWENAAYSLGEANPDVYAKYVNRVNRVEADGIYVQAVDTDGSDLPVTTWRNGDGTDPDAYVAKECHTGTNCEIYPSGYLLPTSDTASERGMRIQALDSAQHAVEIYGTIMDTNVEMHYPGKSDCKTSCAVARDEIHIYETLANHGYYPTHEVGHTVQMQEFNQDDLRDVCGDSHSMTSVEKESCTTTEGFADYVAAVAWYDPNNVGSVPFVLSKNVETATPFDSTCADNGDYELQVARGFWDLDDWNEEAGAGAGAGWDDDLAYGTVDIAQGWRQFANGTANRKDYESDDNGVNMKDYYYNNTSRFIDSHFYETFLDHNCLQYQDYN